MKKIAFILFFGFLLLACDKKPKAGQFRININHVVGGEDLELSERKYSSPAGHTYDISKCWYYLSEISLIASDQSRQTTSKGFLVKGEDVETHRIELEEIAPGTYQAVEFVFGLSKENNVIDYLEATVDNQNMFWPAPVGPGDYHYMKLEGKYDSLNTGIIDSYIMHSGPTFGADNSFIVNLPIEEFIIDDNVADFFIEVDLKEWIQNPSLYDFKDWSMVMMNQAAQDIYKANGQNVFTAGELFLDEED